MGQGRRRSVRGGLLPKWWRALPVAMVLALTAVAIPAFGPSSKASAVAVSSSSGAAAPGYQLVASDGGIFSFGGAGFYGSEGAKPLNRPIVGMAATADGGGYWLVASDGGIFAFGDAGFYGSEGAKPLNRPIVGMAATADGGGYWLVASDGGIFAFGDAGFFGSEGAKPLNRPIVGMAATADGGGYWLVASDGGIFAFGDAGFYGSEGAKPLNRPIVGMAATADGGGYWLVASDGGIFAFGDAGFYGSEGAKPLNRPIVGMAATADGGGYWLVASDGGIFAFGDAGFYGSEGAKPLNRPIVGMAATRGSVTSHAITDPGTPTEVVYGAGGSFGQLANISVLSGGQSISTDAVPGWGFLPGQAVMGAVLGPDGSIVMGGEPQTSNQSQATASTMAVSVFNPTSNSFQNVVVPTSTGKTSEVEPGYPTGGADIAALASVPGHAHQVAFLSSWPYRGWNASTEGQYPTFGYVAPSASGSYQEVPGSAQLANNIDPSGTTCPVLLGTSPAVSDCPGTAAMDVLPTSGDLVVAQYFDDVASQKYSGGLMVLTPNGVLRSSYNYPNVNSSGQRVYALPREVDADPVTKNGMERFAVIFDVFTDGAGGSLVQAPFTMQVFQFNTSSGAITPLSSAFLPGQTVNGETTHFESAHFDQHGNLWAAESLTNSDPGGNIVEYAASSINGRFTSGSCGAGSSAVANWGQTCTPDLTLPTSPWFGDVRSITEDTATGALYFASVSGILMPVLPTGSSGSGWALGTAFDYGINSLVDRNNVIIGPRQGTIDPSTGYLWLPIEQLESSTACNLGDFSCHSAPSSTAQWLVRIDVRDLPS